MDGGDLTEASWQEKILPGAWEGERCTCLLLSQSKHQYSLTFELLYSLQGIVTYINIIFTIPPSDLNSQNEEAMCPPPSTPKNDFPGILSKTCPSGCLASVISDSWISTSPAYLFPLNPFPHPVHYQTLILSPSSNSSSVLLVQFTAYFPPSFWCPVLTLGCYILFFSLAW